jgi:hypothetical protein
MCFEGVFLYIALGVLIIANTVACMSIDYILGIKKNKRGRPRKEKK